MTADSGDGPRPGAVVREVLADPAGGREHISVLLEMLGAEDRSTRLSGAWAICTVADADPGAVDLLARELFDVIESDGPTPLEADLAFRYLRERFDDDVTEIVESMTRERAVEDVRTRAQDRAGGFARSDYLQNRDPLARGVGRTKIAEGGADDPRSVYQNRTDDSEGPEDLKDFDELLDGQTDRAEESRAAARERQQRQAELELATHGVGIEDITEESEFDDLTIVEPGIEGRFATIYRTRAVGGSAEAGVAVCVFRQPESNWSQFVDALAGQVENWAAIGDHDNVLGVQDWSTEPVPWVATDFTINTLYDRLDMDIEAAARQVLEVGRAVSYAHQRGVLHGGLDPYNVVYGDSFMDERRPPLVKHFGLMTVMRQYFEPSTLLDPRYAAPEYYDRRFGEIDNATDIYQLGAVIYRFLTGRPPFEGDYNDVRTAVLNSMPTPPSAIDDDVPADIDDVVRKAMAKQKLTRYETAKQLVRDLDRILDA